MSTAVSKNSAQATPEPAPQYNGPLRQTPGTPQVYLILNDLACWVPDLTTLGNLFVPGAKIVQDSNLDNIKQGEALTSGAVLAEATGTAPVYLLTNGVKMWIPNWDIFNDYQFNKTNIQLVSPDKINSIPTGPNVEGPTS